MVTDSGRRPARWGRAAGGLALFLVCLGVSLGLSDAPKLPHRVYERFVEQVCFAQIAEWESTGRFFSSRDIATGLDLCDGARDSLEMVYLMEWNGRFRVGSHRARIDSDGDAWRVVLYPRQNWGPWRLPTVAMDCRGGITEEPDEGNGEWSSGSESDPSASEVDLLAQYEGWKKLSRYAYRMKYRLTWGGRLLRITSIVGLLLGLAMMVRFRPGPVIPSEEDSGSPR